MEAEIHEHVKNGLTKRGRPKCEPNPLLAQVGSLSFVCVALGGWFLLDHWNIFPEFGSFLGFLLWMGTSLSGHLGSWWLHDRWMDAFREKVEENDGQLCVKCGYILKGLGETGTCPECAMPFDIAKVQRYWRRGYFKMPDLPDPEDIRILREQMEREGR